MTDKENEAGPAAGAVEIFVDGEGHFDWFKHYHLREGRVSHLAALPRGMVGGLASVAIVGKLKDGSIAFLQTSLRIMLGALAQWEAVYGPEADGKPQPKLSEFTRERMNAAFLLTLLREREGAEVTINIDEINALMQDTRQGIEVQYGADNKTLTLRAQVSE